MHLIKLQLAMSTHISKRTLIKKALFNHPVPSPIQVKGWVKTKRDSKAGFSFISLNDGSCLDNIQIIVEHQLKNYSSEISKLHPGASICVDGELIKSQGQEQLVEIQAKTIEVYGHSDPSSYTIGKQRLNFETLRDIAHLRVRTNTFGAVMRVRNALAKATHDFFQSRDFLYIHTPIITTSDCEGAGEMFQVTTLNIQSPEMDEQGQINYAQDFFKKPAYLTVSGQLEGETYACALGNIYTFGPTFRAENSNTSRHLSEFWMVEPEMAFADLAENAKVAEAYLKYLIQSVFKHCFKDLEFFDQRIEKGLINKLEHIQNTDFQQLSYSQAISILEQSKESFDLPIKWGLDLQTEHERYLTEKSIKRPIIITDYPKEIKAFYMKDNPDGKTVAAMDVLVPKIGEIIGGSQREDNLDLLIKKIKQNGQSEKNYWWYLDLRRFGSCPHSGFGLGFERAVQFCTGMSNIRDVIPYPRAPGQAEF